MTALGVDNLSYAYGAKRALKDVRFTLPQGRFCALLGPNGAGKSTLFALLTRLIVARDGDITIAGVNLKSAPRDALARMGVVFQQPTLDLDMSVMANMRYFAALQGMSKRDAQPKIEAALERLSMAERSGEKVRALNGGHRRRMEIARALIHDPAVLLLDEATVGLDAAAREAIVSHVHDLADSGLTVLWATHLVDEIHDSDEVIVLHQGQVLAQGIASEIGQGDLKQTFLTMTGHAE